MRMNFRSGKSKIAVAAVAACILLLAVIGVLAYVGAESKGAHSAFEDHTIYNTEVNHQVVHEVGDDDDHTIYNTEVNHQVVHEVKDDDDHTIYNTEVNHQVVHEVGDDDDHTGAGV
ncbi:hypothetical protein MRX96_007347 [Rhipicephalus microplus]